MISFLAFNHTFHAFGPRFWDFLKIFGVFQNWWSFCKIFGLGLCPNVVKSSYISFCEHFNYIVMHFRCVLYMLSCCVLVGLDWAQPMMFLNLYVICPRIVMHTYLQFLIFLYTTVLVLFWFSLSLHSCVSMLLWHLNANLLYPRTFYILGASSSSDPTPSFVQFHDENARKDFLENFCRRGIHLECHVVLSDFSNTYLPTVIHNRGWESLYDISVTCPSAIIQEFYSNMHRIDTSVPYFFCRVRGMHMVVTPEIVSEVLHVPKVAHPNYPSCECLKTVSKDNSCLAFMRHFHLRVIVKTTLT